MASPAELSLECKPHSYSLLLKSVGEQQTDQTQKLEEFLGRLEEERLKIEAFKRELPLCMQLLTNAMEASRQQLHSYKANQGPKPVLEEFIPLKLPPSEESDKAPNLTDKSNWMISAQLWSQATGDTHQQSPITSSKETEIGFCAKQRNGGAFLPFSKDRIPCDENQGLKGLPELGLASIDKEMEEKKNLESHELRRESSCRVVSNGNSGVLVEQGKVGSGHADSQGNTNNTPANPQTHRKARRCWSPDLHRRFVNALQMLGGSQVATPKQIRELMKVDGLTNDEVKSHLQKYRLHTRRPSPSPQAAATGAPQLVVLGGIWVPPEYAATAHGGATAALYGPHPTTHPSPHYSCAASLPQEFYTAPSPAPPHHQLHHHLHHHPQLHNQIHVYQPPSSQTQSSPESDVRGGTGDRSESMEDGKSESSSWKVDSIGENGGGKKGLMVREEGEESNGSEITLKF